MSAFLSKVPGYENVYGGAHSAGVTALKDEADAFLSLHGMSAFEPRPGEGMHYMRRVLQAAIPFSPKWRGKDAFRVDESILPIMWKGVITDAVKEFKKPVGPLRQVVTRDDSGRTVRHFYGDPANTWAPFQAPLRIISEWNPGGLGRGAKSHTATHAEVQMNGETRMVPLSEL